MSMIVDWDAFFVFDLELFPNFFSFAGKFYNQPERYVFEMSSRKNQKQQLLQFLTQLQNSQSIMVGFNNLGFDYPILHKLLNNVHTYGYNEAYQHCQEIIHTAESYLNIIGIKDRIIPQLDLFKMNHFDNPSKRMSLKALEFAMRMDSVEDLPFPPGTILTPEQMDIVLEYNSHDVDATEMFLTKCKSQIDMRKDILELGTVTGDVLNYSDVKIGAEYLINKIGRTNCFTGSKPNQTFRSEIVFKDIILPSIQFRTEKYQAVLDWFKAQTYYIKSDLPSPTHEANLAGLDFHFGIGGVHASVVAKKIEADKNYTIRDIDVTSMYPSIAIANNFAPEHLGRSFSTAYEQLVIDRNNYAKGTTQNKVLKLGSNGAFGNSDNPYSCFYDPQVPRQITINGQLQILMLVEVLAMIPGLEIIQANTDGITCKLPKSVLHLFELWRADWEAKTRLKLEEAVYSKVWIADVNNYIALYESGKIKLKGKYWYPKTADDYEGNWHKDLSMVVVPKVIEQSLIHGWDLSDVLRCCVNPFDFMKRVKTPSGAKIYIGDKVQPKTVRYYVSKSGRPMVKIANPKGPIGEYKRKSKLTDEEYNRIKASIPAGTWDERIHTKNKSKYALVSTSIEEGWLVKECNRAEKFNFDDVDYDYYLEEIKKLEIK